MNLETNENKTGDEKTHSIPELLRNLPYTSGKRILLVLILSLPAFLKIPILLKYRRRLKLHHVLDSELSLWHQPYHSIKLGKSSSQHVYYRRAIEWQPEDFFRPTLYSDGLEFGLDGSVRLAKNFGSWANVNEQTADEIGLSASSCCASDFVDDQTGFDDTLNPVDLEAFVSMMIGRVGKRGTGSIMSDPDELLDSVLSECRKLYPNQDLSLWILCGPVDSSPCNIPRCMKFRDLVLDSFHK